MRADRIAVCCPLWVTASEITYIVSSGALNSTPTNQLRPGMFHYVSSKSVPFRGEGGSGPHGSYYPLESNNRVHIPSGISVGSSVFATGCILMQCIRPSYGLDHEVKLVLS